MRRPSMGSPPSDSSPTLESAATSQAQTQMKKNATVVAIAVTITFNAIGCSPMRDTPDLAGSTTVTTTITVREGDSWGHTVRQAITESGHSDWLRRLEKSGLADWSVHRANAVGSEICDMLSGGDYSKIIDYVSRAGDPSRNNVLALYDAAMGFVCDPPPDAPYGMPR